MDCHSCQSRCHLPQRSWLNRLLHRSQPPLLDHLEDRPRVTLVGMPNVGKSVLFNALTGTYVTVSNYPGTTVEISHGQLRLHGQTIAVMDTPGLYSLLPLTEEEQVTRDVLFSTPADLVIHVVDAKNLSRMLPLTMQLIEAGFSVLLVLNMMDEAQRLGLSIDVKQLEQAIGVPVVATAAALNVGIDDLKMRILSHVQRHQLSCNP